MALIACVECGKQVSDQAEACPNCGHPVKSRQASGQVPPFNPQPTGKRNTGCALIILLVVILAVVATCLPKTDKASGASDAVATPKPAETAEQQRTRLMAEAKDTRRPDEVRLTAARDVITFYPTSEDGKAAAALAAELEESIRQASIGKQWRYWSNEDAMTGKASVGADVLSSNTHNFDFPYAGPQHATLTLRRHPQHGSDVLVRIEKGQLQCSSYRGCNVLVRFGDAPPRTYRAVGPSDNSSETLFIEGFADFQKRMEAVNVVRIQADVFRQGSPAWEFDVSGFDANRLKRP
ncbi:zinc ribbon domain-containing protein [Stenotrophomonas riyadhensis]